MSYVKAGDAHRFDCADCSLGIGDGNVIMDELEYVWVGADGFLNDLCDRSVGGVRVGKREVFQGQGIRREWLLKRNEKT